MYRIGMFSKLGRTTVKTLRYYDEVGLLRPDSVDEETGYRSYTTDQLFRLNEIVALRQMGFSILEISEIVDGHNVSETFDKRKTELENSLRAVNDQLFRLNHFMSEQEQKEEKIMNYQAVIKEIPSYTVFSAKYTLPNYEALGEIMPALGRKVAKANPGLKCIEPNYCFNVYLDGEYRETDINVEICQAVVKAGVDGDGFTFKTIPAVSAASVLHRGSYETVSEAYAYILQWVEQNGYKIKDNVRESYIDGMWNKDDVADWLTEIQVPVMKKQK